MVELPAFPLVSASDHAFYFFGTAKIPVPIVAGEIAAIQIGASVMP